MTLLAHYFGTPSPSATYIMARLPGAEGPDGIFHPRGSLIAVDELVTCRPNRPIEGLR